MAFQQSSSYRASMASSAFPASTSTPFNPSASSSAFAPPATPIRPLPSTILSSKHAPPLPPASQTYEPLVKGVLASRLARWVFPWALAACAAIGGVWTWGAGVGEDFAEFVRSAVGRGFVLWVLAAVPAIVARKAGLTVSRTPASSPAQLLRATMARPGSQRTLLSLLGSAILFGAFFATVDAKSRFTVFVNSRKHPHYLNPRLLFLLSTQLATAALFFLRVVLRDRMVFPWTVPQLNPTSLAIVPALSSVAALPLAGLTLLVGRLTLGLLYWLPVLPIFLKPFTAHFVRGGLLGGVLGVFNVFGSRALGVIGQASIAGFLTTLAWDVAFYLFDSCVAMPIQTTTDPVVLVSAVSKPSSELFQALAWRELEARAGEEDGKGEAFARTLLADTALWPHVVRPGLLLLGEDYQKLVRRGGPARAPVPSTTQAAIGPSQPAFGQSTFGSSTPNFGASQSTFGASNPNLNQSTLGAAPSTRTPVKPTPLLRASIFKQAPPSPARVVADALAADGVVGRVPDVFNGAVEGVERALHPVEAAFSPLGKSLAAPLERAVSPVKDALHEAVVEPVRETRGAVAEIVAKVHDLVLPPPVREAYGSLYAWWTRERAGRAAAGALPRRETDAVVVGALAHIIAHSLTADRFGAVQRDIPRVMEAMVRFLGEVEGWVGEMEARRVAVAEKLERARIVRDLEGKGRVEEGGDGEGRADSEVEGEDARAANAGAETKESVEDLEHQLALIEDDLRHAHEAFGGVAEALKTALARIVRTFGAKLSAFRFPPVVAAKIQGWMDVVGV
ncbi:nucleoporin protein Ndc1-Nup [Schizophyllum commune]